MLNDSNTTQSIEEKNRISGVAGQLSKYGFTTVTTGNIEQLLISLEHEFGIKAYVVPGSGEVLKDSQYLIKETEH